MFGWPLGPNERHAESHKLPPTRSGALHESFQKLPTELTDVLTNYLSSKNITSLTLASLAFRQLPITLFRRLLMEETPGYQYQFQ